MQVRKNGHYKEIIKHSIAWIFITLIFGLLQLWLSIANNFFKSDGYSFDNYFLAGVLLFFCSGLVVDVSFQVWIKLGIRSNSIADVLFHIVLPILILIAITTIYFNTISIQSLNYKIKQAQLWTFGFSIAYSIFSKLRMESATLMSNSR